SASSTIEPLTRCSAEEKRKIEDTSAWRAEVRVIFTRANSSLTLAVSAIARPPAPEFLPLLGDADPGVQQHVTVACREVEAVMLSLPPRAQGTLPEFGIEHVQCPLSQIRFECGGRLVDEDVVEPQGRSVAVQGHEMLAEAEVPALAAAGTEVEGEGFHRSRVDDGLGQ